MRRAEAREAGGGGEPRLALTARGCSCAAVTLGHLRPAWSAAPLSEATRRNVVDSKRLYYFFAQKSEVLCSVPQNPQFGQKCVVQVAARIFILIIPIGSNGHLYAIARPVDRWGRDSRLRLEIL